MIYVLNMGGHYEKNILSGNNCNVFGNGQN